MKQGQVIRMAFGKNFAFISDGISDKDFFFHRDNFSGFWKDMESDFANGKEIPVQFDIGIPKDKKKGPRAINVSRLDYPNQATVDLTLCSMGPANDEVECQQSRTDVSNTKSRELRR